MVTWLGTFARARPEAGVGIASFLLFLVTLAPGILWGDDTKFQIMAYRFELKADEISHPLFVATASLIQLLPIGDQAWRVNLASAIAGSLAVYFVARAVRHVTSDPMATVVSAGAFAVSHTFWLFAVRPSAHALNALFVAFIFWRAISWNGSVRSLAITSGLAGFGLANHFLLAFSFPAFAILYLACIVRRRIPIAHWLPASLTALAGFAPFVVLERLQGLAGQSGNVASGALLDLVTISTPVRDVVLWSGFLIYNFASPALLLVIPGAIWLWRKDRIIACAVAVLYLVNAFWVFDLQLPDQYKYYIPSYLALSLLAGPGWIWLRELLARRNVPTPRFGVIVTVLTIVLPVLVYAATPSIVRRIGVTTLLDVRNLPGRDTLDFFLTPSKLGYTGAEQYARAALATARPNAIIIADQTTLQPIEYLRAVRGERPDVMLLFQDNQAQLRQLETLEGERPLYLADIQKYFQIDDVTRVFRVIPDGVLYRVERIQR